MDPQADRDAAEELADAARRLGVSRTHQIVPGALVAEACMDIFDLPELEICPWALREGVILERIDQLSGTDGLMPCPVDRALDRLGLPRVDRARLRVRRRARLRRRRGDGRHRRAQPADSAVKQLSDHHEMPVCAVHAPCLLFTQRVWGTEPWGKLERSAEMAAAVGAEVVVVHPPFRWQTRLRPRLRRTASRPSRSRPASRSRSRTCIPGAASASKRGMEMYLPGWDPSAEPYANTTIDLSHAAIAHSDAGRDGRAGSATGCATST